MIRPLGDKILVKPAEAKEVKKGGIIIPDTAKEKPQEGEVIAVGKGKTTDDGKIIALDVKAGDKVTRGQQVAVLDAMKMHNVIGAPHDGTIAEVCVAAGQNVGHGDVIVTFAEG